MTFNPHGYGQPNRAALSRQYSGGSARLALANLFAPLLQVGEDELGGMAAMHLTFGVEVVASAAGDAHRPQARITWGTPKGGNTVVVDLVNGLVVNLFGGAVAVDCHLLGYQALNLVPFAGAVPMAAATLNVSVSLGLGHAAASFAPTFTDSVVTIGAGANNIFTIPRFSERLEIRHDGDPYAAVPPRVGLEFLQAAIVGAATLTYSGFARDSQLTIPTGVQAVRVANVSGVDLNVLPIYHLAL